MNPTTASTVLLAQLQTAGVPNLTAESANYAAKNRVPFSRFQFIPRETAVLTTGQTPWQQLGGLMKVSLFAPRGTGTTDLNASADRVLDKFRASSRIGAAPDGVLITAAWIEAVREEPDWVELPVFVRWSAFNRTVP